MNFRKRISVYGVKLTNLIKSKQDLAVNLALSWKARAVFLEIGILDLENSGMKTIGKKLDGLFLPDKLKPQFVLFICIYQTANSFFFKFAQVNMILWDPLIVFLLFSSVDLSEKDWDNVSIEEYNFSRFVRIQFEKRKSCEEYFVIMIFPMLIKYLTKRMTWARFCDWTGWKANIHIHVQSCHLTKYQILNAVLFTNTWTAWKWW